MNAETTVLPFGQHVFDASHNGHSTDVDLGASLFLHSYFSILFNVDLETLRAYSLAKKGATEDTPFGPDVLVFRVLGKMFALTIFDAVPGRVNLKCDPELAIELRERYESVIPGYHQNKRYWNTVYFDGDVSDAEISKMVDHSYDLVVSSLTKKQRAELEEM